MIHLSNRAVLAISGADAREFLQGLTTQDVNLLAPEKALYAATLSPQGKYLFDYFLYLDSEQILLEVAASRADELIKKFTMYKLRSNVQIEKTNLQVYADAGLGVADPRSSKLPRRFITAESQKTEGDLTDYKLHLLQHGVPDSDDFIIDKSFIMHYRFEELHGVSFSKGCYVGQENTARMKYKGTVRKSIYIIEGEELPAFGAEIKGLGVMLTSQGNIGLALCEIEAAENFSGQKIKITTPKY
jgi:folate-binding protein YgfZ